ncbi:hypothetical protein TELCIR_15798 [Teladorsagia circumcincta]|uniref:Vinculin n=1 Tax=Teladorsagia circumcincta TaxID=45464 RepID=A0A2G9TX90_TELCI|nr:hypothetical protein TELCIR_15798 [Teladorsagia circumcincta]
MQHQQQEFHQESYSRRQYLQRSYSYQDITPWLSRVSSDVSNRQAELTHQVHRDILCRPESQIIPILMALRSAADLETFDPRNNQNYLAQRMTDEMHEIIRVLQLTTYDEDEWDADNVTVMRKALSAAKSLLTAALDWLGDPRARPGAVGEKAIRRILDYADRIGARALPEDSYAIKRSISEIASLTDTICELRNMGRYDNEGLAISCAQKLKVN